MAFLLYINNFIQFVNKLINFTEQFQNGITGYERFLEILAINPEITDIDVKYKLDTLKGNIELKQETYEELLEKQGVYYQLYNI